MRARRREFIILFGGGAAIGGVAVLGSVAAQRLWGARAQPAVPVIGFVSSSFLPAGGVAQLMTSSQDGAIAQQMTAFKDGLHDGDYVEGKNVAIEYRGAGGQYDRLPKLLSDLIRRQVKLSLRAEAWYRRCTRRPPPRPFRYFLSPVLIPSRPDSPRPSPTPAVMPLA